MSGLLRARRRCQHYECSAWIQLDPLRPGDYERRYCSEACERADRGEIQRVEREIAAAEYLAEHRRARRPPQRYYTGTRL